MAGEGKNEAGFVGWQLGQTPNQVANLVGWLCCGFLGLYNFHLILTELESKMGMSQAMHFVKVLCPVFGMLELEKEIVAWERKYEVSVQEETLKLSLIASIPCLWFMLPFKLTTLLERVNAVNKTMPSSEQTKVD